METKRRKLLEIKDIDPVDKGDLLTKVCDPIITTKELLHHVVNLQKENATNLLFIKRRL